MNATQTTLRLMRAARCALLAGLLWQGITGVAFGATCTSAQSGNWDVGATWAAGCGASGPVAGDTVNVGSTGAHTVTIPAGVNAAAASVTIGNTGVNGAKLLTLAAATSTLTVSGPVSVNHANNNNAGIFNVGPGTATMASLTLTGSNAGRIGALTITTGTATVTGNISFAGGTPANGQITFIGTGTLKVGGALGNGGTLTADTGTVEYNGSGAQTVNSTYSYNNLSINKGSGSTASLGGNTGIGGNLSVNAGVLDLSTFSADRTAAGGTLTVANGATLRIGGGNGFPANYTTHTLGATSTVNYNGSGQSVAAEASPGYGHLVLSGSGSKTAAGNFTVRGDLSITGVTFAGGLTIQTVNGNVANTGTHTATTGKILLSGGAAAHALSGTGTYANLELNDANGATLSASPTVSATLTLTSGAVSTGANTLITTANCPGSVSRTGGRVAGFLRLRIPGPGTCTFDVGDNSAYRPIALTFAAGTTAGNLTGSVSQAAGDHPNISTSGLDDTQSANRYWTLTNGGVGLSASGYDATFTFVSPGDLDGSADALQFEIERWSGSAWSTTTVGTRTSTSTQATGISAFGDFASAKKKVVIPTPGSFNAFESSTAAGAATGTIRTKVAGSAFSLDVVAISSGAQLNGFTSPVTVELLGNNTLGVALDGNNCPTSSTTLQTVSPNPTITAGRSSVSFAAVANSWRDVRVRVRYPTSSPTVTSCSTDNFAIRPNTLANLAVSDTDWQTADPTGTGRALNDVTFGTVTHKASRPFTVQATAVNAAGTPATTTNYSGTATGNPSACVGAACTAAFGNFTVGAGFSAGVLNSTAATYDNVGAFRLQLIDQTFASVDAADTTGDCTATGRYICSATLNVGRFVPDHFAVSLNSPEFQAACGSFTYVGQLFKYTSNATRPVITVTAQNFANGTTTLYAGNWWRITNTTLAPSNQAGRYSAATANSLDTALLPDVAGDPIIDSAAPGSGVGTLTFNPGAGAGVGVAFTRPTSTPAAPVAPFDADISLAVNVIDADAVTYASNPARFGQATTGNGIAFTGGKAQRFGILRLENAVGSEKMDLPVPIKTQYYTGTTFATNNADGCTAISAASAAFGSYQGGITATNMDSGHITGLGTTFSSGLGSLTLAKPLPTPASAGAVTLTIDLDAAAKSYLKGNWGVSTYTANPSSRDAFGLYGSQGQPSTFIYFRENY